MENNHNNLGNLTDRIRKIREFFCQGNNQLFAEKIGKSPQVASSLCTGKDQAGRQTIEKILTAFPQVSRAWLMLGDGYMLTEDNIKHNDPSLRLPSETDTPKPSEPRARDNDNITIPLAAWTVIQQQAASLAAKDAQVDKLIAIIEREKTMQTASPLDTLSAPTEQLEK